MSFRWSAILLLSAFTCFPIWSQSPVPPAAAGDRLYSGFQDPPHKYTIRPFWFWNGKLDEKEVNRQIEEMVSQGVYGVFVHNRTGLQTPYLSEDYFKIVGSALKRSKELGFHFSFCDEYEWPSGEARDVWRKGIPSRVIAANPDFRMRALGYEERIVDGPKRVEIDNIKDFQYAVAGRMSDADTVEEDTLADVSAHFKDGKLSYDVPAGKWTVIVYYTFAAQGFDGGLVDLMNRDATRTFLDLTYEQYYKRFPEAFGSIIDETFADHEGGYGYRLSWTPKLFETFLADKGYDLRKYLPLLIHNGGKKTPKVRCDYLDTVSELYSKNFFGQVAAWGKLHGVLVSGHAWEESLQAEATFDGDLQRIERNWGAPGVDSLVDLGRSPHDFKAAGSVAHFRGTRFFCENQGLEGWYNFLSPQKMRLGTNMIAAWGVNQFIPHAFNYNNRRIEYPADWFYHEPYWKYFKQYADYTRRLSFMNDGGQHIADVLLYQPTETAWAHIDAVYSTKKWDGTFVVWPSFSWNNPVDTTNAQYTRLMVDLAKARWDFDVADAHYLREAKLETNQLAISNEKYRVLILPPMTTIRRASAHKIVEFYEAGGTVIATGFLPKDSMEDGRDDAEVRDAMIRVFGQAQPDTAIESSNAAGGHSYFVKDDLARVPAILDKVLVQDVKVTSALRDGFTYSHRQKDGADYYWLVNDSESAREFDVTLRTPGAPEKWDAADAIRTPLFYHSTASGTEVHLHFEPWEAYYVVFPQGSSARQDLLVQKTNLEVVHSIDNRNGTLRVRGSAPLNGGTALFADVKDAAGASYQGSVKVPALKPIELSGDWKFTPQRKEIRAPYALTRHDPGNAGERSGWQKQDFPDVTWPKTWLSRERFTIRQWSLMGPFSNVDYKGFEEAFPPEQGFDPKAICTGAKDRPLHWIDYDETTTYYTELAKALVIPDGQLWVTAYAHTYLYSPVARRVQIRTTADNNAKVWVNGENLLDWLIVPWYYELREDFALTREVDLKAGWNEMLLKVSRGQRGSFAFMVRVTDLNGDNLDDLIASREKYDVAARAKEPAPVSSTWYRIPVPTTAIAVKLPRAKGPSTVFYNGRQITPAADGSYQFGAAAVGKDNVLAIRLSGDESPADEPEFVLGASRIQAGSWTYNGLPYFTGSAAYEKEIEIPRQYAGSRLVLDCGDVGVVADVQVNGKPAGARVWLPFRFDITKLVQPGKNTIRILVSNTMENERAVENHADKLDQIKLNGLLGPVRIIPYADTVIECHREVANSARSAK
jgi:hypothetical protein